jgi:hypothetical protein
MGDWNGSSCESLLWLLNEVLIACSFLSADYFITLVVKQLVLSPLYDLLER